VYWLGFTGVWHSVKYTGLVASRPWLFTLCCVQSQEDDDFFELLSSRLLVEPAHSTKTRAAAVRLLLACVSSWMVYTYWLQAIVLVFVSVSLTQCSCDNAFIKNPAVSGVVRHCGVNDCSCV
jgi:hypothetical protein